MGACQSHNMNDEKKILANVRRVPRGDPNAVLAAIDEITMQMSVGADKTRVIEDEVRKINPLATVVELGAFCGYSAVAVARLLGSEGRMISIEYDEHYAQIASEVVAHAGLANKVSIAVGSSSEIIPQLRSTYGVDKIDYLFIDHAKEAYVPDLNLFEKHGLLRRGSLIIADNVMYPGAPDYIRYMEQHKHLYQSKLVEGFYVMGGRFKDAIMISIVSGGTETSRSDVTSAPRNETSGQAQDLVSPQRESYTAKISASQQGGFDLAGEWHDDHDGNTRVVSQTGRQWSTTIMGKEAAGTIDSNSITMLRPWSVTGTLTGNTILWSTGKNWTRKQTVQSAALSSLAGIAARPVDSIPDNRVGVSAKARENGEGKGAGRGMMQAYTIVLESVKQEHDNVYTFTFSNTDGTPIEFRAGQYCHLVAPGGMMRREDVRHMSFASAPEDGCVTFSMDVGSGSSYKQKFAAAKLGAQTQLFKIKGEFVIDPIMQTEIVFLAGGIGITPIRSLIRNLEQAGASVSWGLLHIARGAHLYADEFSLYRAPQMRTDRAGADDSLATWTNRKPQAWFYICGSQRFLDGMRSKLQTLGISPASIVCENFH